VHPVQQQLLRACIAANCTSLVTWDELHCSPACARSARVSANVVARHTLQPYPCIRASAAYDPFTKHEKLSTKFLLPVSRSASHIIRRSFFSPKPEYDEKAHHSLRAQYITASNVSAIIGANPHCSQRMVFKSYFTKNRAGAGNRFTRKGITMEPFIANKFVQSTGIPCMYGQGLCVSAHYPFLGATFDLITITGIPVEIKCLVTRRPATDTLMPFMYWVQCQVQMEVAQAPCCYYVEYKEETGTEPEHFSIVLVERDATWFAQILPVLQSFWAQVCELRSRLKTTP
jgi:putative phage-type endonuclease